MKLSNNFLLNEFGLPYDAGALDVYKAKMLAVTLLQPVRDLFGPVNITSGYRSEDHNAKIGGARNSDHLWRNDSAAVDFVLPQRIRDVSYRLDMLHWLIVNCRYGFGQLIHYTGTNHTHISLAKQQGPGQVLVNTPDGYMPISGDSGTMIARIQEFDLGYRRT